MHKLRYTQAATPLLIDALVRSLGLACSNESLRPALAKYKPGVILNTILKYTLVAF